MIKNTFKILITLFLFSGFSLGAFANNILQVNNFGVTEISGNSAFVNITVSFNSKKILTGGLSSWELSAIPIDSYIVNSSNASIKVPLRNLTIYTNGKANTFTRNRAVLLEKSNRSKNNISKSYQLKLDLKDAYSSGHYMTTLQFNLQSGGNLETYLYTVDFYQKDIASYEILSSVLVQNDWNQTELKRKGARIELNNPVRISVKSNKKWKLYLNSVSVDDSMRKPKLYFKVAHLPKGMVSDFKTFTRYNYSKPAVIAQGEPTIDKFGAITSKVIELRYRISAKDDKSYIRAGNFTYDIDYELITQE